MNYKTKTNLILPFKNAWLVSNGGRTPETNNHVRPPEQGPQNQLYAYDFRQESTGKETELEDYTIFGKEVIAPGDGIINDILPAPSGGVSR